MLPRFGHFLFWFLGEVEIVHVIQGLNTSAVQRVLT